MLGDKRLWGHIIGDSADGSRKRSKKSSLSLSPNITAPVPSSSGMGDMFEAKALFSNSIMEPVNGSQFASIASQSGTLSSKTGAFAHSLQPLSPQVEGKEAVSPQASASSNQRHRSSSSSSSTASSNPRTGSTTKTSSEPNKWTEKEEKIFLTSGIKRRTPPSRDGKRSASRKLPDSSI